MRVVICYFIIGILASVFVSPFKETILLEKRFLIINL